jgi:hypothetical protein
MRSTGQVLNVDWVVFPEGNAIDWASSYVEWVVFPEVNVIDWAGFDVDWVIFPAAACSAADGL